MENNELKKNVVDALYYYRLKRDLILTENKINDNQILDYNKDKNVLVRFWNKNIENSLRRDELTKYETFKAEILKRIENFTSSHKNFDYDAIDGEEKIKNFINKQLKNDSGLARINLAILSILQKNEFANAEQTLEEVSRILFENNTKINNLSKQLEKNYIKLSGRTSFDDIGKNVLLGIGLATTLGLFGLNALVFGWNIAFESLLSILVCSAIITGSSAIVYKLIDKAKKEDLVQSFRKLSLNDMSVTFAVHATLIEEARKLLNEKEFKEYLDSSLKFVNDLRADTEYLLLIEKEDIEVSKKKIKIFNNWTSRLSSIVLA